MTYKLIDIQLFKTKYAIKCQESQVETLKSAAIELTQKVKKIQKKSNLSLSDSVLLTALNLCGEQIDHIKNPASILTNEEEETFHSLNMKLNNALSST